MSTKLTRIDLLGDSILDNASYVEEGGDVSMQLTRRAQVPVQLVAVDGDVTTDLLETVFPSLEHGIRDPRQGLETRTSLAKPDESVGAVLSIGGNDALGSAQVLIDGVESILEAFTVMEPILSEFRRNYVAVLDGLLQLYEKDMVRVCTIYNKIPTVPHSQLPKETMLALGLFNDIITEEVYRRELKLLDLRVICDSFDCYSDVSPIEPSEEGGRRIVQAILNSFQG